MGNKPSTSQGEALQKMSYWEVPEGPYDALPVEVPGDVSSIPLHALADASSAEAVELARQLREVGYCVVSMEDDAVFENLYEHLRTTFAADIEEKKGWITASSTANGYKPLYFDNRDNKRAPEIREVFQLYRGKADYSSLEWPSKEFEATALDVHSCLFDLSQRVLDALAVHFGLEGSIHEAYTGARHTPESSECTNMAMFQYKDYVGYTGEQRCMSHEDNSLVTILPRSTFPGIQVLSRDRTAWHKLEDNMGPGDVLIYTGEPLARITANLIPAVTHRVVRAPNEMRWSAPFQFKPNPGDTLRMLASREVAAAAANAPASTSEVHQRYEEPLTYEDLLNKLDWDRVQRTVSRTDGGTIKECPAIAEPEFEGIPASHLESLVLRGKQDDGTLLRMQLE